MMTTFVELKDEGVRKFGEVGAWAYDEWENLNETFFNEENRPGPIVWGLTLQDRSLGYYSAAENLIYLNKNLLRPIYPTNRIQWDARHLNKKLASDVLLHEMIHQGIHQAGGWEGETSHNNERFVEEVNRISKLLGLEIKAKVIKKRIYQGQETWNAEPGYLTLSELFYFPYASRKYSYYYGER